MRSGAVMLLVSAKWILKKFDKMVEIDQLREVGLEAAIHNKWGLEPGECVGSTHLLYATGWGVLRVRRMLNPASWQPWERRGEKRTRRLRVTDVAYMSLHSPFSVIAIPQLI